MKGFIYSHISNIIVFQTILFPFYYMLYALLKQIKLGFSFESSCLNETINFVTLSTQKEIEKHNNNVNVYLLISGGKRLFYLLFFKTSTHLECVFKGEYEVIYECN